MKPWLKTRSDKSACANIILELLLTTNSGIILESMLTSYYWSYIIHSLFHMDYLYILYYLKLQFWHSSWSRIQKQLQEMFLKILKFHRKTHVLGSLFYKAASLQAAALLKRDSCKGNFLSNLRNSSEHLFWRRSERLLLCIDYSFIYWFLQFVTDK